MSRSGSIAAVLAVLVGCGGKKPPKLRADTLAQLTQMADNMAEVPPREVAEAIFQGLVEAPGLFPPACAEVLDSFLDWKPAERGQRFATIGKRCAVRCPLEKDFDALERSQPEDLMPTLTRACDARGPDQVFGDSDRVGMELLDYASMRFVLEHTKAALEADGSPEARRIWSALAGHIPAIAKLLTPARVAGPVLPPPAPSPAPIVADAPAPPDAPPSTGKLVVNAVGGRAEPEDPNAIPAASITAKLRSSYMGGVRACYEHGLPENPGMGGRVTIEFTIEALGTVHSARIASSELASASVEECLVASAKSWSFARPTGGQPVKVTFPFIFRASPR